MKFINFIKQNQEEIIKIGVREVIIWIVHIPIGTFIKRIFVSPSMLEEIKLYTQIKNAIPLIIALIIYHYIIRIIIHQIIKKRVEKSVDDILKRMEPQIYKEKFYTIVNLLSPLFQDGYNYSFHKILDEAKMEHYRDVVKEINESFGLFQNGFYCKDLQTTYKDLCGIISRIENNFHKQIKSSEWSDNLKKEYSILKNIYNPIIEKLNAFGIEVQKNLRFMKVFSILPLHDL